MMNNFDLTAVATVVSTAGLGGITYAIRGVVNVLKHADKIKKLIDDHGLIAKAQRFWKVIEQLEQHFANNAPAMQAAATIEQAATTNDTDLRDALIKAAVQKLPQALQVEVTALENVPLPMICEFLSGQLPQYKDYLNPSKVAGMLQLVGEEVEATRAHDGVKLMKNILDYLAEEKQQATVEQQAPTTDPEQSEPATA